MQIPGNDFKIILINSSAGELIEEISTKKQKHTVTISQLPTGIYFITLSNQSNTQTFKFIKQ